MARGYVYGILCILFGIVPWYLAAVTHQLDDVVRGCCIWPVSVGVILLILTALRDRPTDVRAGP